MNANNRKTIEATKIVIDGGDGNVSLVVLKGIK